MSTKPAQSPSTFLIVLRILYLVGSVILLSVFVYDAEKSAPSMVQLYPVPWFTFLMTIVVAVLAVDMLMPKKRLDEVAAVYIGLVVGLAAGFYQLAKVVFGPR